MPAGASLRSFAVHDLDLPVVNQLLERGVIRRFVADFVRFGAGLGEGPCRGVTGVSGLLASC